MRFNGFEDLEQLVSSVSVVSFNELVEKVVGKPEEYDRCNPEYCCRQGGLHGA